VCVVGCRIVVSSRRRVVFVAQSSLSRSPSRHAVVFVAQCCRRCVSSRSRHGHAVVFVAQSSLSRSRLRLVFVAQLLVVFVAQSSLSRSQICRVNVSSRHHAVVIVAPLSSSRRCYHCAVRVVPCRPGHAVCDRRADVLLSRRLRCSVARSVVALSPRVSRCHHRRAVTRCCRRVVVLSGAVCTFPSHSVAPSCRRAVVAMSRLYHRRAVMLSHR
jgi:hypothetical protein